MAIQGVSLQYRPEIDGLRAIAVLPVILFHAGISGFSGGFVGVDIFFVLSGYLITSILWTDMERGDFTFRNFYERRIRRILPAMVLVIACTLVAGWFWLAPDRYEELGMSAAAALYSVSNFYFYGEAGYFARASETQPLLHTWSLGVEEQFYFLFPVALLALHRRTDRSKAMLVLALVAIASLALCEWLWRRDADANFFLIPSRAWELMAGSLCALYLYKREMRGNSWLAGAGLAMIAASIVLFDKNTPFPSTLALLPVGGTVLVVLYAQGSNAAVRLLSLRPLVGIGLISYSAYLWHQPVLAFARLRMIDEPSATVMLGLSLLSLVLAYFSWKYSEQPFRRKPKEGEVRRFSGIPAIAAAFVGAAFLSTAILASDGVRQRFEPAKLAMYEETSRRPALMDPCKLGYGDTEVTACENGERGAGALRIALIGDSHASQWTSALADMAKRRGWLLDTYAKSACPMAEVDFSLLALKRNYHECASWREALYPALQDEGYDLVIATQSALGYLKYEGRYSVGIEEWDKGMQQMAAKLDALPGRWLLLADNPQFRDRLPVECIAKTELLGFDTRDICIHHRSRALDTPSRAIEQRVVAGSSKGSWLDLSSNYCDEQVCRPYLANGLVMSDRSHLSNHGTSLAIGDFESAIAGALEKR